MPAKRKERHSQLELPARPKRRKPTGENDNAPQAQTELVDAEAEDPEILQRLSDDEAENDENDDGNRRRAYRFSNDSHSPKSCVEAAGRGFANVGILESVRVENFMCHRHFEYKFGPNVNIINGPNGSGKSAIVAALQIGLGVSARQTERGQKLADHIMHGESSATVSIRIRNRPPDDGGVDERFRAGAYGDTIVIERKLSREGSSTWNFRDARGKRVEPVDRPRSELDAILDCFCIYVDNPVAILTQQKSKQFLAAGKEKQMYQFFKQATLLALWEDDLLSIRSVKEEISTVLAQKRKNLGPLQTELRKLEQRYNEAKSMDIIEDQIAELKSIYAWSTVYELEDDVDKLEETFAEKQTGLETLMQNIEEAKQAATDAIAATEEKNARLDEISAKLNREKHNLETANSSVRQAHREVGRADNALRNEKKLLEGARHDKLKAERDLEAERAKKDRSGGRRSKIQAEISNAQAELEGATTRLQELEIRLQTVGSAMLQMKSEEHAIRSERSDVEKRMRAVEHDLREARQMGRNDPRRFGRDMSEILKSINASKDKFHRSPIGPIGQYLSLEDENWSIAVQMCLGNFLGTFVVHDVHDENLLRSLYRNIRMVTTSFDATPHEIRPDDRPPEFLTTVLDVVRTPRKEVYNTLVDQMEIERQVLFRDRTEFERYAYDPRIPKMSKGWLPDGSSGYSRSGSRAFLQGPRRPPPPLLQKDTTEMTKQYEHALAACQEDLEGVSARQRQFERSRMERAQEQSTLERERQTLSKAQTKLARDIEQLQFKLDEANGDLDVSVWEARIQEAEEAIRAHSETVEQLRIAKEDAVRSHKDAEDERDRQTGGGVHLHQRSTQLTAEANALVSETKKAKLRQRTLESRVSTRQTELSAVEDQLEDARRALQSEVKRAERVCPKLERDERPSLDLKKEIDTLQSRIDAQRERNHGLSKDQVEKEYQDAVARRKENDKFMHESEKNLKIVSTRYKKEKHQYKNVKKSLRKMTSLLFGYYLSKRKHTGSLKFDDDAETLQITVSMNHAVTDSGERVSVRDIKSLSGGERSFTTLSLMLALGETMHVPFRVMDEFDVFMDEANRRASYETLISVAREQPNRQFIFITPLEMPNLRGAGTESLRVQKLHPPQRNPAVV